MNNVLLLASKSKARQQLLTEAQIPFEVIEQDVEEKDCDWGLPLVQLVEQIALHKMNHVMLPACQEGAVLYVLTADTLSQDPDGTIQGKPVDRQDAIAKIKTARNGARLATGFCLDRKIYEDDQWKIDRRIVHTITADYIFDVPDNWIERYLDNSQVYSSSNAIGVEGYGGQFLKQVIGSYSTIVGLPMYELRQALDELGFFKELQ